MLSGNFCLARQYFTDVFRNMQVTPGSDTRRLRYACVDSRRWWKKMSGKRGAKLKLTDSARKRKKKKQMPDWTKTKSILEISMIDGRNYGRNCVWKQIPNLRRCWLISKCKHCWYNVYKPIFFKIVVWNIVKHSSSSCIWCLLTRI